MYKKHWAVNSNEIKTGCDSNKLHIFEDWFDSE